MALLYRFSKNNDRNNSGVFTFIVTRSVTRDLHRDATTKDFYYGYHRWAISFIRANDKVLGVYLILRDPSPSTTCLVDYSLTLLNREHFSRNEQWSEKQCKFTVDHSAHGINKWIPLSDIQTRNFGDETGEFLLELNIGNITTVFEAEFCLQGSAAAIGGSSSQLSSSSSNNQNNHQQAPNLVTAKNGKFETSYFHFATFEWNICIMQHNPSSGPASMVRGLFKDSNNSHHHHHYHHHDQDKTNRPYLIYLNRLTGFENSCRVQYRFVLGQNQCREDSGMVQQISDMNGRSRGYPIDQHTFTTMTSMGVVNFRFEFFSCNPLSEAKVPIARSVSPTINCYDRNKQGWSVESDIESDMLKLKLYFMDMHSVPRNHLRYVSWFTYLVAQDQHSGTQEDILVKNSPHYNYYIQDGIDMGIVMETDIPVSKIKSSGKKYLENDSNLMVRIEWYDSIMLFNNIYHKYDDIARIHCYQMRREITALTSENLSLERQIFSYQRSISVANNTAEAMARLSIVSPSKLNPSIGFSSSPVNYCSQTHLNDPSIYYNNSNQTTANTNNSEIISTISPSDGYYDSGSRETTSSVMHHLQDYSDMGSSSAVTSPLNPTRPSQFPGQLAYQQQQPPQQQQYLNSTFATNSSNGSSSQPGSARQSFSGPASPHHQQYQQQQQQQQSQQTQSQQQQSPYTTYHHHHQLPIVPNKIPYSTSGYRLHSPNSNPNIVQMYHDEVVLDGDIDQTSNLVVQQQGGNGNEADYLNITGGGGSGGTGRMTYSNSRYKLQA